MTTNKAPKTTFETLLPFSGFYQALFEDELDQVIEYVTDELDDDTNSKVWDLYSDGMDYRKAFNDIAKDYADWLVNKLHDELKQEGFNIGEIPKDFNSELQSPKEYNFTTDKIWVDLPPNAIPNPTDFDNMHPEYGMLAKLDDEIRQAYTSRDGFISFVSNQVSEALLNGDFIEADPYHNSSYVMLLCEYYFSTDDTPYIANQLEWDFINEVSGNGLFFNLVAEHCSNWNEICKLTFPN